MTYALIKNGKVEKYPYSIVDLKQDNPNTSFPQFIPTWMLRELGIVEVSREEKARSYLKNYTPGEVVFFDGKWVEKLIESDASSFEIEQRIQLKWDQVRAIRNDMLKSSDWTQLPDASLSVEKQREWADYRQVLRDITQDADPFFIDWPEEPSK